MTSLCVGRYGIVSFIEERYAVKRQWKNEPLFHQVALWENEVLERIQKAGVRHAVQLISSRAIEPLSHEITMEYAKGVSLNEWDSRKFCETLSIGKQLLECVLDLQPLQLIHCDLKPVNLKFNLQENLLKVLDWGYVSGGIQSVHPDIPMAIRFRAPEALLNPSQIYGPEVQIWAIGIILIELLTGEMITKKEIDSEQDMLQELKEKGISPFPSEKPYWVQCIETRHAEHLSGRVRSQLIHLLVRMLEPAETRITAEEALKHPIFYSDVDFRLTLGDPDLREYDLHFSSGQRIDLSRPGLSCVHLRRSADSKYSLKLVARKTNQIGCEALAQIVPKSQWFLGKTLFSKEPLLYELRGMFHRGKDVIYHGFNAVHQQPCMIYSTSALDLKEKFAAMGSCPWGISPYAYAQIGSSMHFITAPFSGVPFFEYQPLLLEKKLLLLKQILRCVAFLSGRGFVHTALSDSSIFVDPRFGSVTIVDWSSLKRKCSSDESIWKVGYLAYKLIVRKAFAESSDRSLKQGRDWRNGWKEEVFKALIWEHDKMREKVIDFLEPMLTLEPSKKASASKLLEKPLIEEIF